MFVRQQRAGSLIFSKGMGEGSLGKSYLTSQIKRQKNFIASAPKIAGEKGKKKKKKLGMLIALLQLKLYSDANSDVPKTVKAQPERSEK